MTAQLDLPPAHLALVRDVLRTHLPNGARVLVFGSRVHGGARPYSDLDLAVAADRPLGLDLTAELREAFSESDLPYKVDIVDLSRVEAGFRARIEAGAVPLLW